MEKMKPLMREYAHLCHDISALVPSLVSINDLPSSVSALWRNFRNFAWDLTASSGAFDYQNITREPDLSQHKRCLHFAKVGLRGNRVTMETREGQRTLERYLKKSRELPCDTTQLIISDLSNISLRNAQIFLLSDLELPSWRAVSKQLSPLLHAK